ncbi:LSU ribosomal protein L12AE [Candidatus Methanoperedens nitroreducens]|uniref:Large ribosomal subunit protein P1 n=1 Tax=Candidatus Methanoperedens nitratireducens TaxID=1392998 RepID=A0A062VDB3_9EURY|nr:50S ribosomal protein P1 [Candidatus Methanoperedens nitroreducens]KCZ73654.1 LSU ribosomal protein L12AE [Candidatus Methanoperedens nitroreducens]MDJ1422387.1 50S ribosomal protein P1 [Candidatus Methanoperedens sp.]
MEYVYAALLLHSAGKKVTEEGIADVIKAAGLEVDVVRAKALVSALEGVNIEEAISKAAFAAPAPTAAPAAPAKVEEAPKEEKKEEEGKEKAEESGMEGLGALFG